MNKKVVYTAIFGGKDILHDPKYIPDGFDFICFTDSKGISSSVWDVVQVDPPFEDPVRCARFYKIMPHLLLKEYKYSVWVDGNMVIVGDIGELIEENMKDTSFAVYNHANLKKRVWRLFWVRDASFARNCIYKEAEALIARTFWGRYMDDPTLIQLQMDRYKKEGYPQDNGLAVTTVLLRDHLDEEVKKVMEAWWAELEKGSRRDQLSFNYVAWKYQFHFKYMPGDPRYNKFFLKVKHIKKENYQSKN